MSDRTLYEDRVRHVNWRAYSTAYGNAADKDVPGQLLALALPNEKEAVKAAGELWAGLCHQHAYVSSAAHPSYPFLIEVMEEANDALIVEILDIIVGFAICTLPGYRNHEDGDWIAELRAEMLQDRSKFQSLTGHENSDIKEFAVWLLDLLDTKHVDCLPTREDVDAPKNAPGGTP